MAKRSITDEEIALIKAMLARGMKNSQIQFFFNRPDRQVNSGRITDISQGKYSDSASIPAAPGDVLDAFVSGHELKQCSASVSVPADSAHSPSAPLDPSRLAALFMKGKDGLWRLRAGESDEHECKAGFGFKHPSKWLRAVAALSNNRGGYVLFGVLDKVQVELGEIDRSYSVAGLVDQTFKHADAVEFTKLLKATFDPTPRAERGVISVGGKEIGVLYVHVHTSRPVIATRSIDEIREGDIFYRYPAQSARIKYSDLRALLDDRDAQARQQILPMVERLLALGPQNAMIADLATGTLRDGRQVIQIDEGLLKRISFIREGEFDEKEGAQTLRLVGDVHAVDGEGRIYQRGFVTKADLLRDFVHQETPADPKEYIKCAVEGAQGDWLPIHFFARRAAMGRDELVKFIQSTMAPPSRKKVFVGRARGQTSAFKAAAGRNATVLFVIKGGELPVVENASDAAAVGHALQGLSEFPPIEPAKLLGLLDRCMALARDHPATMSVLRRAICRIDELLFMDAPVA